MEDSIGTIDSIYKNNSNETVVLEENPRPRISDIENNTDTIHQPLLREENNKSIPHLYYILSLLLVVISSLVTVIIIFKLIA